MAWPPEIGDPLPRAAAVWCVEEKWASWILAERGHGTEWRRVFHVDASQWERIWEAIATAVIGALIETVRSGLHGSITCGVMLDLTIGNRTAAVSSAWHYAAEGAAPRLVTAYPKPYHRSHGDGA
jgi:hypothetical protein